MCIEASSLRLESSNKGVAVASGLEDQPADGWDDPTEALGAASRSGTRRCRPEEVGRSTVRFGVGLG